MRTRTIALAAALLAAGAPAAAAAQAVTLTFDDVVTNSAGFNAAPFASAGGFQFENWGVLTATSPFGTGANAVSGSQFAYAFAGAGSSFIYRTDAAFDVGGFFASFRALDGNVAPASITVRGYRGADRLFAQTLLLTNNAQLFQLGWAGIDELEFETLALDGSRSAVLALDDVRLTAASGQGPLQVVPEPATVVLLGSGLVLTAVAARRRAA